MLGVAASIMMCRIQKIWLDIEMLHCISYVRGSFYLRTTAKCCGRPP